MELITFLLIILLRHYLDSSISVEEARSIHQQEKELNKELQTQKTDDHNQS